MTGIPHPSHTTTVPHLSIVIPAHNEEKRITPTLEEYARYFAGRAELIVVSNGCSDRTHAVAVSLAAVLPSQIVALEFTDPIGKGGALIEGFKKSRGDVVGFVDADGATTPIEFERLCGLLTSYDMVFGSRWIKGAQVYNRTSLMRKLASRTFVILVKLLFGLPYHDTQCGVKIFTRNALERVLPHLSVTDSATDVEILLVARSQHLSIHEEPTVWTDKESSVYSTSFGGFLSTSSRMFRSLLQLRLRSFARERP